MKHDQLDIVLTCGEQPGQTLVVSGPLTLWAKLLSALVPSSTDATVQFTADPAATGRSEQYR
jgi:hypothetical protein